MFSLLTPKAAGSRLNREIHTPAARRFFYCIHMAALAELRSAADILDGYQDREYRTRQSERITNLMWERVVSRDSHLPSGGGTHQSLALYNRHGIVTDNPITQELRIR